MSKAPSMPLALQIEAAVLRVRLRQQLIACRTAQIETLIRKKMTAPSTLLAAVAAGFLLQRCRRPLPLSAGKSGPEKRRASSLGLFARLAEILAVVRSLLTSWPAGLFRRFAAGSRQPKPVALRKPASSGYPPRRPYA